MAEEKIPVIADSSGLTYDAFSGKSEAEARQAIKKILDKRYIFINTETLDSSELDESFDTESDAAIGSGPVIAKVTGGGKEPFAGEPLTLDPGTGNTLTGIPDDWCPDEYVVVATALRDGVGRQPVVMERREHDRGWRPHIYDPNTEACSGFHCVHFLTSGGEVEKTDDSKETGCTGFIDLPMKFRLAFPDTDRSCKGITKIILEWKGPFTSFDVLTNWQVSGTQFLFDKRTLCLPSVFVGDVEECVDEINVCAAMTACFCNYNEEVLQLFGHRAGGELCMIDVQPCPTASGGGG